MAVPMQLIRLHSIQRNIWSAVTVKKQGKILARTYSAWDRGSISWWLPMTTIECSPFDSKRASWRLSTIQVPIRSPAFPVFMSETEEEFIRDIEKWIQKDKVKKVTLEDAYPDDGEKDTSERHAGPEDKQENHRTKKPMQSFTTYLHSRSSVLGTDGKFLCSERHRYEDSKARMKAVHYRQIDDKEHKSVWTKESNDDEVCRENHCTDDKLGEFEFEKEWEKTPFGELEADEASKGKQKDKHINKEN